MVHPATRIRGTASNVLQGRRIVLAISGSIAAVKTVELARALIRNGADVLPVMTPAACRIVHPDALRFATGNEPVTALSGDVEHVTEFGESGDADLLLVAPATANTVAKMALGIDDTALTTFASVALGAERPVLVAPAMHAPMEENPPTQAHLETLRARGVRIVRPLYEEGKAKLAPVDEIVQEVARALGPHDLDGRRVLVITGAGREAIDPVRVLTNRSSGRMGAAVVAEAHRRGAEVHALTSDPEEVFPPGVHTTSFEGVRSLLEHIDRDAGPYAWVFCPAALADYAPLAADTKLSSGPATRELRLERLPKVLPEVQKAWKEAHVVGWKLEDDLDQAERSARERLTSYGLHAFVANASRSLGDVTVEALLVTQAASVPLVGTKSEVAEALFDALMQADRRAAPTAEA